MSSTQNDTERRKSLQTYLKELQEYYILPLDTMKTKILVPNAEVFEAIKKAEITYKRNDKEESLFSTKSDFSLLVTELDTLKNFLDVEIKKDLFKNYNELIEKINQLVNFFKDYKEFNILQFQRIDLVAEIFGLWSGIQLEIDLPDIYKYIFVQGNNEKDINTLKSFVQEVKFDIKDLLDDYKKLSYEQKNWHYIIYKTIQIFETYPSYKQPCYPFNNLAIFFEGKNIPFETYRDLRIRFIQLNRDDSHITSKIKRSLNFAVNGQSNYVKLENKILKELKISKAEFFELLFPNKGESKRYIDNSFLIHLDELKGKESGDLEQLTPPIFHPDIIFQQTNSRDYTLLSSMSSGEKQLLFSTSAIIYHLQNIRSVDEKESDIGYANLQTTSNLIKYNNVNLVLEEIELYFHPEFQRLFVKYLLDAINKSTLDSTMSLNIIFVTHSPFILSDIPKQNVLFLKEGKPTYDMQENTFGANIHSILKNGFFLDTLPIGDFSHDKINEMFRKLNSGDIELSKQALDDLYQNILLVGEPYLRGQLLSLFSDYKKNVSVIVESRNYQKMAKKIKQLENNLKSLRNKYDKGTND